jgi:hypothetical protein
MYFVEATFSCRNMRSQNLQTANSHSGYTPSARPSPTIAARAHQDTAQYASGSPVNIRNLPWRPEEETSLVTRHVAGAREFSGNDDNAQAISQLNASSQSLAEPEPTNRAIDTPGSELPREEIMKAESEAADCQKGADKLEKAADHERNSCKERETSIAATKERATEVEKRLQTIRDELKI